MKLSCMSVWQGDLTKQFHICLNLDLGGLRPLGKFINFTLWPQLSIFVMSLLTLLGFWTDNLIGLHMIPLKKRLQ